jgi:GTP-binding protein YchF
VPLPDGRLERLATLVEVDKAIHATIQFVDVAGLVKGASKGEGLGNKFLGNIRDVDAIIHVVRCFDDPNVVHVSAHPNPKDDIEVINTELALADLEQLEKKIEKLERRVKGDKKFRPVLEMAIELIDFLGGGQPLWTFPGREDLAFKKLNTEMRFLTAKPVIYAANVDENSLAEDNDYVIEARAIAGEQKTQILKISAKLEEEIGVLPDEESQEYLELAGISESGLDKVIRGSYELLGLISYFSFNTKEVRAWTINKGSTAPQAAGVIHTDFERGFIKAEVVQFDIFEEHGSFPALKTAGLLRIEGREYVVQDGDVVYFRFNV